MTLPASKCDKCNDTGLELLPPCAEGEPWRTRRCQACDYHSRQSCAERLDSILERTANRIRAGGTP